MGTNVAVFVAMVFADRFAPEALAQVERHMALDPRQPEPWAFISYQFVHGGFLHLLFNMVFLWVFGPNVEDRLGRLGYLAFYLVGGAAAGGLHALFEQAPVVGASGSISAVTGAFLVFFPRVMVRILFFLFVVGVFEIPAWWFIAFAIARDLVFQGFGGDDGVARLAHIGGYLFGAAAPLVMLWTGAAPREPYDLFSLGRQAHRRRVFRGATSAGADPWRGVSKEKQGAVTRGPASEHGEAHQARVQISRLVAAGDFDEAARLYRETADRLGGLSLPRQDQVAVANRLFEQGKHKAAAEAYEEFLRRHERATEASEVRLMLGLLYVRYLDRAAAARRLLERALPQLADRQQRALAQRLLEEAGGAAASAGG